jgi:D-apionolactonase
VEADEPALRPAQFLSEAQLLRGTDRPPDDIAIVRAGELSAEFSAGGLRYLRLGDIEVVRRVVVAVRDQAWNTIPPVLSDIRVRQGGDGFRIAFQARHQAGELDFAWTGLIRGTPDGSCSFSMDGTAGRSFRYRRIGICVLLPPAEFAGRSFVASSGGESRPGLLPDLVAPPGPGPGVDEPLVPAFARLILSGRHLDAELSFTGDLFEIEDQRNWTDASFKSYSRLPAVAPAPERLATGTRLRQTVVVAATARGRARRALTGRPAAGHVVRLAVGEPSAGRVPEIGLACATEAPPPAEPAAELLARMTPAHLRVDLHLNRPGWPADLDRARSEARRLGCPLEVAVFLDSDAAQNLGRLAVELAGTRVGRVLVYRAGAESTPAADVIAVRRALTARLAQPPVAGGTDLHFAELNRSRPDVTVMDGVAFPITPQVHAADEDSMAETPDGVRAVLRTARAFCAGRPVLVSPISLRPRFNPDATDEAARPAAALPDSVDPRQMSLFGACWTLATLAALAEEGVSSTTWFEAMGPRGVIDSETVPPFSGFFPSRPGLVFPVYHVLRDACELSGTQLLSCSGGDPLRAAALAVRRAGRTTLLAASLRPEPSTVEFRLPGPDHPDEVMIRRLNTTTAAAAMLTAESFRSEAHPQPVRRGVLRLDLLPYEYCRLDFGVRAQEGRLA